MATDSGDGSAAAPFRTLAAAVRRLLPGEKLYVASGVYREPILIPNRDWGSAAETVIEGPAAPAEPALVKGSIVATEWLRDSRKTGLFVASWTIEPQQVFIDGQPLKQLAGTIFNGYPERPGHELAALHVNQGGIWPGRVNGNENSITPGSFYYDRTNQRLFVDCGCSTLNGRLVEVSVVPRLLVGRGLRNFTIRNLHFQHSNTSLTGRGGTVLVDGRNVLVERISVKEADSTGVQVIGSDVVLRDSEIVASGQLGLAGRGTRIRILNNVIRHNNTRGFNKWWEAGGAKFVGGGGLANSEVSGNVVEANNGDGIWFDWGPANNLVRRNVSRSNTGFGIHYEASFGGTIVENLVVRNGQRGIYLLESSDNLVALNVVAGNGLEGIVVVDEGRRDNSGRLDLLPDRNFVCGNLVAWNRGGAITLPADLRENRSDRNTIVGSERETGLSLGWWPSSKRPVNLSLADWQARTQQDAATVRNTAASTPQILETIASASNADTLENVWATITGARISAAAVDCWR